MDTIKNFLVGTCSGVTAVVIIQPMDMIKVRSQLASEAGKSSGVLNVAKEIASEAGAKGFYKGIDSAILRQCVYGTARLGIYFNLSQSLKQKNNGANLTTLQKAGAAMTAGAIGSFVGNPCDLALVRLQADATLPPDQRRNYKHVGDAFMRITKEEGVTSLWKGALPTMTRAMALNTFMFVTYDTAVEVARAASGQNTSETAIQIGASALASVATSVGSLPFDNIKTKIQKQKAGPDGVLPYKGIPDCFTKTVAKEGLAGLWSGLPAYYMRLGPQTIIILLVAPQYRKLLGVKSQ